MHDFHLKLLNACGLSENQCTERCTSLQGGNERLPLFDTLFVSFWIKFTLSHAVCALGEYPIQRKIPVISRGIFRIFRSISKRFRYSTIFRRTSFAVLWKPGWEKQGWLLRLLLSPTQTEGGHLTRLHNVLLVTACTSEEANTKHVGFVGELVILHKWKNTLPQHE